MKFFIPKLGDKLTLLEDFTFPLFDEYRNDSLFEALGFIEIAERSYGRWGYVNGVYQQLFETRDEAMRLTDPGKDWKTTTLPAGTMLKIDRIYIRKGQSDFDSVTFQIVNSPLSALNHKKHGGPLTKVPRFWVKLSDMCQASVEWLGA